MQYNTVNYYTIYTAFHTYNTAMISTPLIHGINDRMVLMAEMVTVEFQAKLDCQTGQEKRDHWPFSYASNEYSTRLLKSNYFLILVYQHMYHNLCYPTTDRVTQCMNEWM